MNRAAKKLFQNVSLSLWERVGVRARPGENKDPHPALSQRERGFETTPTPMAVTQQVAAAVAAVQRAWPVRPQVGLILGTGLGNRSHPGQE
jgi:hypothetical protein